jgi:quinol monooxygenase YgiN
MTKLGQLYTSGLWTVKPGREDEFIRAWQEFADRTAEHQIGAGAALLIRDIERPNRLISFGDWDSRESIQKWRGTAEFAAFFEKAQTLCEDIQPGTFNVVAHIGA